MLTNSEEKKVLSMKLIYCPLKMNPSSQTEKTLIKSLRDLPNRKHPGTVSIVTIGQCFSLRNPGRKTN